MADANTPYPVDADCIFCRIVAGRIPCAKLYEDAQVLSFLDIGPLSRGHALVIPKGHWVTIDSVPVEVSASCGRLLPSLSRAIVAATGATAWNVLQNNGKAAHQEVDHVHFHVIPKFAGSGLDIGWPAGKLGSDDTDQLVAAIARAL